MYTWGISGYWGRHWPWGWSDGEEGQLCCIANISLCCENKQSIHIEILILCYWSWPFYCEGNDGEYWGVNKGLCYHNLHIAKYLQKSHLKIKRRFSGKRGSRERKNGTQILARTLCRNDSSRKTNFIKDCNDGLSQLSDWSMGKSDGFFSLTIFRAVQTFIKADGRDNISPKQDFQYKTHCIVWFCWLVWRIVCPTKK